MVHPDDKIKQLKVEVPVSVHKQLDAVVENTHYKSKAHAVESAVGSLHHQMGETIAKNSGN